jgi:hypothetical protein
VVGKCGRASPHRDGCNEQVHLVDQSRRHRLTREIWASDGYVMFRVLLYPQHRCRFKYSLDLVSGTGHHAKSS